MGESDLPEGTPLDPVRKAVHDTIENLLARKVMPGDRARLRDAVDKADRPQTGRAGSDDGLRGATKGKP